MRHLRAGDVLVITRLDRLGRSVKHLAALAVELQERNGTNIAKSVGIGLATGAGAFLGLMLLAVAIIDD